MVIITWRSASTSTTTKLFSLKTLFSVFCFAPRVCSSRSVAILSGNRVISWPTHRGIASAFFSCKLTGALYHPLAIVMATLSSLLECISILPLSTWILSLPLVSVATFTAPYVGREPPCSFPKIRVFPFFPHLPSRKCITALSPLRAICFPRRLSFCCLFICRFLEPCMSLFSCSPSATTCTC